MATVVGSCCDDPGRTVVPGVLAASRGSDHRCILSPEGTIKFPNKGTTGQQTEMASVSPSSILIRPTRNVPHLPTKIMTADLVLMDFTLRPNHAVTITARDVSNCQQGLLKFDRQVPLSLGRMVTVQDLLWALM